MSTTDIEQDNGRNRALTRATKGALGLAAAAIALGLLGAGANATSGGNPDPADWEPPTGMVHVYIGSDSTGNPLTAEVDIAAYKAKAQRQQDELTARSPGSYYIFGADAAGEPIPSYLCVLGAASDEQKRQLEVDGVPPEAVAQAPSCAPVD